MMPILTFLSFLQAIFVKVDVDECPETAEFLRVKAMPTFKVLKGSRGEEVAAVLGARDSELKAMLDKHCA